MLFPDPLGPANIRNRGWALLICDNSSAGKVWVAEVTDNAILELKSDVMPHWFKTALWDKFGSEEEPA